MKRILCWGTGKKAKDFIKAVKNYMDDSFIILSFIDNDRNKVGNTFEGYPIISPEDITTVEHDLLLILNTFEDEIRTQINEMNIKNECVLNYFEFCDMYIKELWLDKDVVFVGDKYSYEFYEYLLKYTFKSYEFIENYNEEIIGDRCVFICAPRHISPEAGAAFQDEIIKKNGNNIHREEEFSWFVNADKKLSFGDRNPDKTFFILHGQDPKSGLGNIIIRTLNGINYAYRKNMIPVIDLKNIKNQYIPEDQLGKKNAWELFFKPVSTYSLEEVYGSKNVILSCSRDYEYGPGSSYNVVLNEEISKKVEDAYNSIFPKREKVLGAVYRGTDYYTAYNHPQPESIDDFERKIRKEMTDEGYQYVFLATEIQEVVDELKKRLGDKLLCTSQKRYSVDERRFLADVHFDRENDEYQKGVEYLIVLELLARCDKVLGEKNATIVASELIKKRLGKYKINKIESDEGKKVRILIITTWLGFNGASYAALYAAIALHNIGYYVCIAVDLKGDKKFIEEITKYGIDVMVIEALPYIGDKDIEYISDYDLVITNIFQSIYSTYICAGNLPVLWWLHEIKDIDSSKIYEETRKTYKNIDYSRWMKSIKVCAVSEIAKYAFESSYEKKVDYILPFGIPDREKIIIGCKAKTVIAYIGSLNRTKGIDIFVDAAIEFANESDVEFWIIGAFDPNSSIYKYVSEKSEGIPNIKIWGEKNISEMEELYSKIDVVVCASRIETMSMTIVEGMMYGKICITTDTTGISKYIENYENGLVIQSESTDSLANAINWVIERKDELQDMQKKARKTYEDNFSMDAFAKRLENIICETITDFERR